MIKSFFSMEISSGSEKILSMRPDSKKKAPSRKGTGTRLRGRYVYSLFTFAIMVFGLPGHHHETVIGVGFAVTAAHWGI